MSKAQKAHQKHGSFLLKPLVSKEKHKSTVFLYSLSIYI